MSKVVLMQHQKDALKALEHRNRCFLAMDMGTGKTHTSTEKLSTFDFKHAMVVCQKSMVGTWISHLETNYPEWQVINYTKPKAKIPDSKCVIVVNYDLIFRRPELRTLKRLSVILDEATIIANPSAKRTKAVLRLDIENIIMLSGSVSKGRYETLWTSVRLCGWNITKSEFYARYVIEKPIMVDRSPFPIKIITGYRNVESLKSMLRNYGFYFLKTEDVLSLPEQTFVSINVDSSTAYKRFRKHQIVEVNGKTLVGDTTLTRMLHERQLCGKYSEAKLQAFADLLESTDDRLVVFYNFNEELTKLEWIAKDRPLSYINGSVKDLTAYENEDNSVTFVQYQAGAMGINLQKANKIVYFTLPLSSELFEQSKKRTHRIGQEKSCFYYLMLCKDSIEEKILKALKQRRDYTNKLFENN